MVAVTLPALAREAHAYFRQGTRADGATSYWYADGEPAWVHALIYAAHDDGAWLPDDHRYRFVVEAVCAVMEAGPDAAEADLDDLQLWPDVYAGELTGWLASNVNRLGYLDEVLEELADRWRCGGRQREAPTGFELLEAAQAREKAEVLARVLAELRQVQDQRLAGQERDARED